MNLKTRQTPEHESNCMSVFLVLMLLKDKKSPAKANRILTFHWYMKLVFMMGIFSAHFGGTCICKKGVFYGA